MLLAAGFAQAQCPASLSATQNPIGNALLNVSFTNSSSYGFSFPGQKKSFNINYGDATVMNNVQGTAVPDHAYGAPGSYTVGFRIRSYDSATGITVCTDSTTITVTVGYPTCGTTITVTGTGSSRTFTATTPAGSTGMSYFWYYGDGNTGTGSPVTHTYSATGNYTVTLVATNSTAGCSYTNSMQVFVYVAPPPLNCGTLKAAFTTNTAGNVVTFTNSSNVASGAYQTIGFWDYGDGFTYTGYNSPSHTYAAIGTYTVKLVMQWKDSLNTTSCKDSVTKTVTITSLPAPVNIISGNIVYDTTGGTKYFKVYLIQYDSATNWLSAVDSTLTGNTASPYYAFGNKPAGNYRVKAAVYNGSVVGSGFVPTYHDSSVYWNTAQVIIHNGGSTLNKRIYMLHGTPTSGSGFIGGNVSYGANKGTGGVPNLLIFLRNANMRVIQMTLTDSVGNYSFPNIAFGPYSVWPELINYSTIPVTPLQLNSTYPSRNDIDFTFDESKRSILPKGYLAVKSPVTSSDFVSVTPVPASDHVTISWNGQNDASVQFTITNMTGAVVARTAVQQGHAGSVNVSLNGLAHGVYFVHGSGSLAGTVARLVIQ
jgi:PKD repeat protein